MKIYNFLEANVSSVAGVHKSCGISLFARHLESEKKDIGLKIASRNQ